MKNAWREINTFLGNFLPPVVRALFLVNVGIFLLFAILTALFGVDSWAGLLERLLMQKPRSVVERFYVWQLFTYMFMHGHPMHLAGNMIALWFFAPRLEMRWGHRRFLVFYLVVGVGAGLIHLATALLWGRADTSMLGASGAIYGILLAFAMNYPNDTIYLNLLIPIKAKYFVLIIGILAFLGSIQNQGGISHITHLGGFLVAWVFLKSPDWWNRLRRPRRRPPPRVWKVDPRRHPDFK